MYERILSLAPSNTELLYALGVGDKVVGVTSYCDWPLEAGEKEKIGSWIYKHDLTLFEKSRPDLILAHMFVPDAVREWAEKNEVQLVNLYPQTLDAVKDSFLEVGRLVGEENKARILVDYFDKELEKIKSISNSFHSHPKIYSEEFHNPPTLAANWVPELIELAGGIPMASPGKLSYEVSGADVLAFDPDMIVLHWCGFGMKQKPKVVLNREGWKEIRAVKENDLFVVDDTFLNRPGPRLWQGAALLQKHIKKYLHQY